MVSRIKSFANIVATEVNRMLVRRYKGPYPKLTKGVGTALNVYLPSHDDPDSVIAALYDSLNEKAPFGLYQMDPIVGDVESRSSVSFCYTRTNGSHVFLFNVRSE